MSKRSSCQRTLEQKLRREVGYLCPLCGSLPLVCAHTVKTFSEVGWDYNYLLAICVECEQKVEGGEIKRQEIYDLKKKIKLGFSDSNGIYMNPFQISPISNRKVQVGKFHSFAQNDIINYKGLKIIWLEDCDGKTTLNARFYDFDGMVIAAIDRNMWTADRERLVGVRSGIKTFCYLQPIML